MYFLWEVTWWNYFSVQIYKSLTSSTLFLLQHLNLAFLGVNGIYFLNPQIIVNLYPNRYINLFWLLCCKHVLHYVIFQELFLSSYSSSAAALNFRKLSGRLCCMETGNIQLKQCMFKFFSPLRLQIKNWGVLNRKIPIISRCNQCI